jgi:hypothetical protein
MMIMILRGAILLTFMTWFLIAAAHAETRFDAYFGLGTATVGSTHQSIDFLGSGVPLSTPSMDGLFGTFGGALMLKPSLGFGGQATLRFRQGDYAGLEYRPVFYDFNAFWTPRLANRIMPEFQSGLGGVNMRLYNPYYTYFNYDTGQYTNYAGSTNHFQFHASAGLRIFLTYRIFIRPTLDYRWVNNFTWFKSNHVPAYSIAVGYTTGD